MMKTLYDFRFDLIMSAEQYVEKGLTIIFQGGGGYCDWEKIVCMRKIDKINCLPQRCI